MSAKPKESAAFTSGFPAQTASVNEIADLLDLTPRRIQQLVGEGAFSAVGRGVYDVRSAVRGYVAYLAARAVGSAAGGASGKVVAVAIAESKARHEAAKAEMAEIELAERKGDLVPSDQVEDAWVAMASNMRAKMLEFPNKAGPAAMMAASPFEAIEIVRAHVVTALEELSNAHVAVDPSAWAAADEPGEGSPSGSETAAAPDDLGVG